MKTILLFLSNRWLAYWSTHLWHSYEPLILTQYKVRLFSSNLKRKSLRFIVLPIATSPPHRWRWKWRKNRTETKNINLNILNIEYRKMRHFLRTPLVWNVNAMMWALARSTCLRHTYQCTTGIATRPEPETLVSTEIVRFGSSAVKCVAAVISRPNGLAFKIQQNNRWRVRAYFWSLCLSLLVFVSFFFFLASWMIDVGAAVSNQRREIRFFHDF